MQRYDLTADMYEERYAEEQRAKYRAALDKLDVGGGTVLDVGCGTGLFFSQVASSASVVLGVDVSRKLLLKAKDQAKKEGSVFVLQADADHLPFRDGFFDAVFAFTVLQNMPDPQETLGELRRASKSGGKVVVTGLKRVYPLGTFRGLLEDASMQLACFVDDEDLKCYVAVLAVQ